MMVEHVLSVRNRRIRVRPPYAVAGGTEARSSSGTSTINPWEDNYLTIETVECDNYAADMM